MTNCSKPNTPETAEQLVAKYHKSHRMHGDGEIDSVLKYETEPRRKCRVPSCQPYAPIDCGEPDIVFGGGGEKWLYATDLKDCYAVRIQETINYADGCSASLECVYHVVIGKNTVLPASSSLLRAMRNSATAEGVR